MPILGRAAAHNARRTVNNQTGNPIKGDMAKLEDGIRRAVSDDALLDNLDPEARRAMTAAIEKALAAISALFARLFGRWRVLEADVDYGQAP